jgi:hypothetical protein
MMAQHEVKEYTSLEETPTHRVLEIVDQAHRAFKSGRTRDVEWRKEQLRKLYYLLVDNEERLIFAYALYSEITLCDVIANGAKAFP